MEFAKGHGTGNDFVVLADLAGELALSPGQVRALCDRRTGLGADGVLRVVPTRVVDDVAHLAGAAHWFMDYRNADGSVAEMCGNGARVYARWLQRAGLVGPGALALATRGGIKTVTVPVDPHGDLTVAMGAVHVVPGTRAVTVPSGTYLGLQLDLGNPHVVVEVTDLRDAGPLLTAPQLSPPDEANVEFVRTLGPRHLSMRVHERGVGETQSCGTGACAAAVAASVRSGAEPDTWVVDVPGGQLTIEWDGVAAALTGPATIVATGVVDLDWLAGV